MSVIYTAHKNLDFKIILNFQYKIDFFTKCMSNHTFFCHFHFNLFSYKLLQIKFLFCDLTTHMNHKSTKCIVLGSFQLQKIKTHKSFVRS